MLFIFSEEEWRKHEIPSGKKVYYRLVAGFGIACIVGTLFITLGAVYFEDAQKLHDEKGMTLPLFWCISGFGKCSLESQ